MRRPYVRRPLVAHRVGDDCSPLIDGPLSLQGAPVFSWPTSLLGAPAGRPGEQNSGEAKFFRLLLPHLGLANVIRGITEHSADRVALTSLGEAGHAVMNCHTTPVPSEHSRTLRAKTTDSLSSVFGETQWRDAAARLGISSRETDVSKCLFAGYSEKETATRLGISQTTVHTHLNRLHLKLNVRNRAQLLVTVFLALHTSVQRPAA